MYKKLILLVFLISAGTYAQKRGEKIKAFKTAYITEKLELSSAEAEKFWPVYNAYQQQLEALRKKEKREVYLAIKNNIKTMSDADANVIIDKAMGIQTRELQYNNELIQNLRGVLSPKKIIKLKKAEEDFKRKLLERFRQRKGKQ